MGFNETQSGGILREVELGAEVSETCRKHNISSATTLQVKTSARQTVACLAQLRGAPFSIRLDNEPEFIARALVNRAKGKGIALNHLQPGVPTQNAYMEQFAGPAVQVMDGQVFGSLQEVKDMTAESLYR